MNHQEINKAFEKLKADVLSRSKNGTSCEDVLQYMYENQKTVWFMSWDVIGRVTSDGKFLSHRSPARLSDLAIHDPQLVEDRSIGRFKAYRLRTENISLVEKRLGMRETAEQPKEQKIKIIDVGGVPTAQVVYE